MVSGSYFLTYLIGTLVTLTVGLGVAAATLKSNFRLPPWVPFAAILSSIYLLAGQLAKLYANRDYVDFAAWNEILYNIVRGNGAWSSIQEGLVPGAGHWFSTHFTPLVYLFALPFALAPRAETLILVQFSLLMSAVLGLYMYARKELGSREYAAIVAAIFVMYPTYQYIHLYEFDMLRFSIPLLVFTFYLLENGYARAYWLGLGGCLLVREEVAITTTLLGIYIVLFMREQRWVGEITAAMSVTYFIVVTQIVMPMFRTTENHEHVAAQWFAALGGTMPKVALSVVTQPELVFALVTDPVKLANLFMYGLPVLFVPLLALPVLMIPLGNVAIGLLSGANTHVSYFLYYLSPTIPFIFIALVKGVAVLGSRLDQLSGIVRRGRGTSAVLCGLFAGTVAANAFFGPSPLSLQFWLEEYRLAPFRTQTFHYTRYVVTPHERLLAKVIDVVPETASVAAEQHLLTALSDRRVLRIFPDIAEVDFVVIDKTRSDKTGVATVPGSWDGLRRTPQYYYDSVEGDAVRWRLVTHLDGYFVYERRRSDRNELGETMRTGNSRLLI